MTIKLKVSVTVKANDGRTININQNQVDAITVLSNTRKGGIASVVGYKPTTGYVPDNSPTNNIQMITRLNVGKLYERKLKALDVIHLEDIGSFVELQPKLKELDHAELALAFINRKATMIKSMKASLDGTLDNNHTKAQERCYAIIGDVKVHLVTVAEETTEKNAKGQLKTIKVPLADEENGHFTVASIMVPYLQLNSSTIVEGVRLPPKKSGVPVLIEKCIDRILNQRSVGYKTLSLKADNFEKLVIDGNTFLPEHFATYGDLIS